MKCPKCFANVPEGSSFCNFCGSSLLAGIESPTRDISEEHDQISLLSFSKGEYFGKRYRILGELGRGGMGMVYKAEDTELGIVVALKMIHPEFLSNVKMITRFKKEILLAREISHENVVRIHDFGEIRGIKFITMHYIEGTNLKEKIRKSGPMEVNEALDVFTQICRGLEFAHKKGIVHRDLKPQNIMIDKKGKVYITDFGLAKSIEAKEVSLTGTVIGTPEYISPEQAGGKKVDPRSDIYTLGAIMYEIMTGTQPFNADTPLAYLRKHIYETPQLPSMINPNIPSSLEKIILKSMEKDMEKRFQSVKDILENLKDERIKSKPIISKYKVRRLKNILIAFILIVGAGAGIYFLTKGKRIKIESVTSGSTEKSVAVVYFENNTQDKKMDHWKRAIPDLLITDLSQSRYLRVLPENRVFQILKSMDHLNTNRYSPETLRQIAAEGRVNHIIMGTYSKIGDKFKVSVKIWESKSKRVKHNIYADGKGVDSLFSMVDRITWLIKPTFDLSREKITDDIDLEIGQITTRSNEAFKHYIQGKRYYLEEKYQESVNALKKAIDTDSKFALAYKYISMYYGYLGYQNQVKKHLEKATQLVNRVSEREKYLITGYASWVLKNDLKDAVKNYKKLLEIYKDDEQGVLFLGSIYRQMEEWDLALKHFNKAIEINLTSQLAFENLIYIYMAKGQYEEARNILVSNKSSFTNKGIYSWYLAYILFCQSKFDLALNEAENALFLEPNNYRNNELIGNVYHSMDDFLKAEKLYKQLINNLELNVKLKGQYWKSFLFLMKGEYKKCEERVIQGIERAREAELSDLESDFLFLFAYLNLRLNNYDELLKISNQALDLSIKCKYTNHRIFALHFKGLAYVNKKKMDEAKGTAEKLKKLIEKTGYKKRLRHHYHLRGMIGFYNNEIENAINYFKKGVDLLPFQIRSSYDEHAFFMESMAFAYFKNNDLNNAQKYYEKIVNLTTGRLRWGDIYAKSYYMLGKIFQKKGWPGKAIENYEKFLDLWKNADPGIKEIYEAKVQLKLLKGI